MGNPGLFCLVALVLATQTVRLPILGGPPAGTGLGISA
jgi:hypothetical protein